MDLDISVGVEIHFACKRGIKIDLVLVWEPKLTWFLCGGQYWLGRCLRAENDFFLAWGLTAMVLVYVVETDSIDVSRPEITRF